eukprot:TRINITY_DN23426_c0_g1_i1.p1 TRINITY_DN23426_c0_g1~~TRINITY_DN23426_c0_g1_i1.p1  ORF type:complete len:196 (-),score=37.27 TRINITY_DN23426_c0_g1_i1:24-611(-)
MPRARLFLLLSGALLRTGAAGECPAKSAAPVEKERWRCISHLDAASGLPVFDEACIQHLGQRQWWGFEEGEHCREYWNKLWGRLAGEIGSAFGHCVTAATREAAAAAHELREAAADGAPVDSERLQLEINRNCSTPALCAFEHSHFGSCSPFYKEEILPHCAFYPFHSNFCTEVCPPPPPDASVFMGQGMLESDL